MSSTLRELLHHFTVPTMYDSSFGLGLYVRPNSLSASMLSPPQSWVNCSSIINEKDEFQVSVDVQQFKPEELSVNVKGDWVVVKAKHEEKKDQHGYVSRQFTRRYQLPETIDSSALKASLSSDGVLQLSAPLLAAQEINIPIIKINGMAAALLNSGCETAATCNGDSNTVTVNGDSMTSTAKHKQSPTSSPIQPILKKPRVEVDN